MANLASDLISLSLQTNNELTESADMLASQAIGFHPGKIDVIRRGSNLVLKANTSDILLRLQYANKADDIKENMQVVGELAGAGAPILGPISTEAFRNSEIVLTAWPLAQPVEKTEHELMGYILKFLHSIAPPAALTVIDVASKVNSQIDSLSDEVPPEVVQALREHSMTAADRMASLPTTSNVLLHGDAHLGNLVRYRGVPRLIDLDDLCVGPKEFDLIPSFVSHKRFSRNEQGWLALRRGYGNTARWDLVEDLAIVRETTMNTWLAGLWTHGAQVQEELLHRIETWDQSPSDHRAWEPV